MARQLSLIATTPHWRLDDRTREIGRQGVASARAALAASRRPADADDAADDRSAHGARQPAA